MSKFYAKSIDGFNALRHPFLLIIRLYWGASLAQVGLNKWINLGQIGTYFASLHIPMPHVMAVIVATIELLGGISLFFGLFSRFFALLIVCVLSGAYAVAHLPALTKFFTEPSLFIAQEPFHFLFVALIVLCFGPGIFSVDYFIKKDANLT